MNAPVKLGDMRKQAEQPAEQKPLHPYEALKRQLEASKAEFLPLFGRSQKNVDAFVRVVLNAVLANPELLAADRRSLIAACMKAAQDGLMPDGREAVLNIYSTKVKQGNVDHWIKAVQYLPMVAGDIKLMYQSGEVLSVDAAAVFANDRFVWRRGDDPKLEHEPTMADDCGPLVGSYCVVKLRSGEIKREVMPMRDIQRVREVSKSPNGATSPWVKWPDQMAIKSVIHRIKKQLPKPDRFNEGMGDPDNEAMGLAATPESVATITARQAFEGAPAGHAGGALSHSPPDPLDMDIDMRTGERVAVGSDAHEGRHTDADGAPQVDPVTAAFDFEAHAIRMRECKDLDTLDLMADDLRDLPDSPDKAAALQVYKLRREQLEAPPPAPAPAARTSRTAGSRGGAVE